MATDTHHQPHHESPEAQPHVAGPAPQATPGLAAVQAVTGTGEPAAMQVVGIIRAHSDERDEIVSWLQQNRGNAFVQQVMGKMGQVEANLPAGVSLDSVNASIMIPGNRKLTGGLWSGYSVKTREPTEIRVEVTHKGVSVRIYPPMYLDLDWPLRDAELSGASMEFGKNEPQVDIQDGGGIGAIPLQGTVRGRIANMLHGSLAGTKLVTDHYDPTQDPDLAGTLDKVMKGFVHTFEGEDAGDAKTKKAPIGTDEMTHITAGATISVAKGAEFATNGSGITIAAKSAININVVGGGNAKQLMSANGTQSEADAANIQGVNIETEGLEVIVKGKPVARLESLTLERGGKITVDRMTPLGKLAEYEKTESGLSALFAILAVASRDPHGLQAADGAYRNAEHPVVVDGISRGMIEQEFTDTIHKLIIQYRGAVPGIDLARSLGIG
jgi:hypothetical protein